MRETDFAAYLQPQESHYSCFCSTLHIMLVVHKPHLPLGYIAYVRSGRRQALTVVTFLLLLEFPSCCVNFFQTGNHCAGSILHDRLSTRRSAGSNDIALTQGNSRARTGSWTCTDRSLRSRRPSCLSGKYRRPSCTSADNVVEKDGIPVLSHENLQGLPTQPGSDPGRLTTVEEERHARPTSSPGTRSAARPRRWRRWRHGALAGITRVFGRPIRALNRLGPGGRKAASLDVPQDLMCDHVVRNQIDADEWFARGRLRFHHRVAAGYPPVGPLRIGTPLVVVDLDLAIYNQYGETVAIKTAGKGSGATRNDSPATNKAHLVASADKSLLTSPDNYETNARNLISGKAGGKTTHVEKWRRRRRSSNILADAAAVSPPGGTATAAATVEQTVGQRREKSEDEEGRPHSSLATTIEYDGEGVSLETWAKVNALRRRAESSGTGGEDDATEGVAWWRTGGENGVGTGLTDVDLLRFIMYRHGDVNAAWEQLKQAGRWRKDQRVDQVLSEERWAAFKAGQAEVFWLARDYGGRPTLVLRSIAHLPGRIEADEFQRYLVYVLEQGRKLWGVGSEVQMNILIDRVGAGLENQDPWLLAATLPIFRDAYPDIIYRCYVAPTSWIFRFVWAIGARLVDARQRKRVLLLSRDWKATLLDDFDSSVLPVHLGGTMKDYPPDQPPNM